MLLNVRDESIKIDKQMVKVLGEDYSSTLKYLMRYPSIDNIKDMVRYSTLLCDFPTQESANIILNDIYTKMGKPFLCFGKPNISVVSPLPLTANKNDHSPNEFAKQGKDAVESTDGLRVILGFII